VLTALVVLAVLGILFGAAALATSEGEVLRDPAPDDHFDTGLPAAAVQPEDVAEVRFDMALRGYRMSEVDEVLARLADELADRDARIRALEDALVQVVEPAVTAAEQEVQAAAVPLVEEPEALAPLDTGASAPAELAGPLTATTWWQTPTPELATDPDPEPAPELEEPVASAPAQEVHEAPEQTLQPEPLRPDPLPLAPEPVVEEPVASAPAEEVHEQLEQTHAPEPLPQEPEAVAAPEPSAVPELTLPAADDAFSFPELLPPEPAPVEDEPPLPADDWWAKAQDESDAPGGEQPPAP
jgi:DivIVA domain-containing protein